MSAADHQCGVDWPDELKPWIDQEMRRPEFRSAYYRFVYSEPLPLRVDGAEYHRRQKRRTR